MCWHLFYGWKIMVDILFAGVDVGLPLYTGEIQIKMIVSWPFPEMQLFMGENLFSC